MIGYTLRRLRRMPLPALGTLLFAVILSVVICGLQKANDEELAKFNETFYSIPVQITVTNLSGTKSTDLEIPMVIAGEFTSLDGLGQYVTDVQMMCSRFLTEDYSGYKLVGITSTRMVPELWAENGADIRWIDGYDEGAFLGTESVCLVPQGMNTVVDEETGQSYVVQTFKSTGVKPEREYLCRLLVVGTYTGGDGIDIYCPYRVGEQIYINLGETIKVDAVQATLSNNDELEALRTASKQWFAEPNPLGEKTPWGQYGNEFYLYALDIDDYLLQRTVTTLKTSMTINWVCTGFLLVLAAAAGFLIGFLMVRNRKKEIALMRTMGTANQSIYTNFALEQMLCVVLGIALGGVCNRWYPAERLGILATTYFVGLTMALLIFLRKNLLTTIKEDE